jgi:hypothetical protein
MPTFSEEIDFVITTYDFLDDCDNHEIENIIDYLEELGYLKNFKRTPGGKGGISEEEFQERIQKISESRHRLTLEEEETIKKISDRL